MIGNVYLGRNTIYVVKADPVSAPPDLFCFLLIPELYTQILRPGTPHFGRSILTPSCCQQLTLRSVRVQPSWVAISMETCPNPTRELILELRKLTGSPCPLQCCFLSQLRTMFLRLAHLCISLNSWVGTLFNYSVYVGFYGALGWWLKSARRFHARASTEQRVSGRKWHFKPCVWFVVIWG